ncbi:hypothetical protein [Pseudarthrobacter sp. lyk4-40-TYG-27]|uniref:TolB family protein n=1 Tax=Pseudarthrobacter sp. lyk4-40-TYG-27 TaxID=3040305 RepID=UPI002556FBE5|nr:hypothetical protein [Pseudarthrobacter sp. lyk4-40-TYG-27]
MGLPALNNDHVLAPDRSTMFMPGEDGHIYGGPLEGGAATRITDDDGSFHFLHGISPDGGRLAYADIEAGTSRPGRLRTIPAAGGPAGNVEAGDGHCDGPEYFPDGDWLYLNTECFSTMPRCHSPAWMAAGSSGIPARTSTAKSTRSIRAFHWFAAFWHH